MNLQEQIGNASHEPTPYTVNETNKSVVSADWLASFSIDGDDYICTIQNGDTNGDIDNGKYGVKLDFASVQVDKKGNRTLSLGSTNKFHQFKIMSTIIQIAKDYLVKFPRVETFQFSGLADFGKTIEKTGDINAPVGSTRFKMYMAFAQQNLPSEWKLEKTLEMDDSDPNSMGPTAIFRREKVRTHPEYLKAMERKKQKELENLQENIHRIKEVMGLHNEWKKVDGKLIRVYDFPTYEDTINFVNKVADIAQEQNHHPEMVIGYDTVKVIMFDHEEGGISDKCHKFTDAVDDMVNKEESLDERSRSFAFTRKKRLFPRSAMMANPNRFKSYDKEVKNI